MLSKRFRLKSPALFRRAMDSQRVCSNGFFTIFGLRRPEHSEQQASPTAPKFGFVVSRKVHKRAVRRNKIRRRFQEIVRTRLIPEYAQAMSQYSALVVLARARCLEASYQELEAQFVRCFQGKKSPNILYNTTQNEKTPE